MQLAKVPIGPFLSVYFEGMSVREAVCTVVQYRRVTSSSQLAEGLSCMEERASGQTETCAENETRPENCISKRGEKLCLLTPRRPGGNRSEVKGAAGGLAAWLGSGLASKRGLWIKSPRIIRASYNNDITII